MAKPQSLLAFMVMVLLLISRSLPTGPGEQGEARRHIEQIERVWVETRDPEVLNLILADDFVYTDADAHILNKKQYMDTVSKLRISRNELKDVQVKLYDSFAVVLNTWSGTYTFNNGPEITESLRYTDVFIHRNGAWQVISSHASRIP